MSLRVLIPLICCITIETLEHVCYSTAGLRSQHRLGWTALGIGLHLLLLAVWLWLLTLLPLGVALPLRGISYITIAVAGWLCFREPLNRRSWAGVLIITLGVALVCGNS